MLRQIQKQAIALLDTVAELIRALPTLHSPEVYLADGIDAVAAVRALLEQEEPRPEALLWLAA